MNNDLYLRVREREGRLYSDEVAARLPDIPRGHPLRDEWRARAASAARLIKYVARLPTPLTILDLGSGNGWLSNRLAQIPGCRVLGLDQNAFELAQAARVFARNQRLIFTHADIFCPPIPDRSIDLVVIASALQYFPVVSALLRQLGTLLTPRGEIHVLDSPLYTTAERPAARARAEAYYAALGIPEMAAHYHHHTYESLTACCPEWLYQPNGLQSSLRRLLRLPDSPFPWLRLRLPNLPI